MSTSVQTGIPYFQPTYLPLVPKPLQKKSVTFAETPATRLFDTHAAPDSIALTIDMNAVAFHMSIDIRPFAKGFREHREGSHELVRLLKSSGLDCHLESRKYRFLILRSSLLPMRGSVNLTDEGDDRYVTTDDLVRELLRVLKYKPKDQHCNTKGGDAFRARDRRIQSLDCEDPLRLVDFLEESFVLVQITLNQGTVHLEFKEPPNRKTSGHPIQAPSAIRRRNMSSRAH